MFVCLVMHATRKSTLSVAPFYGLTFHSARCIVGSFLFQGGFRIRAFRVFSGPLSFGFRLAVTAEALCGGIWWQHVWK